MAEPPAREDDAALRQTQQQLEFALRAGRLGSWELDLETQRYSYSDYCRVNFGLGPDDPFDTVEDIVALVHPDDRERRRQAFEHAIRTGADLDVEYRVMRPDGRIGWVLARGQAAYRDGKPVRIAGISLDITERKETESRQRLLLDELNHRVKNTLASVQSIALQTRRFVAAPADFDEAFIARLTALARVHELLSEASWDGASLADIVSRTLAPYLTAGEPDRMSAGGPTVRLDPNAAVTLNMAFHELATNAAKYGSLSSGAGRIDIQWRAGGPPAAPTIEIDWRETGGPPVRAPARRGFGSRLIEQALALELGGEARLVFLPQGLICQMRFPPSGKLSLAA